MFALALALAMACVEGERSAIFDRQAILRTAFDRFDDNADGVLSPLELGSSKLDAQTLDDFERYLVTRRPRPQVALPAPGESNPTPPLNSKLPTSEVDEHLALYHLVAQRPARSGPPNVILISLDTTRADRVTLDGSITPNLAHLARLGTAFDHVIATANESIYSHAAMLTGLYPSEVARPVYEEFGLPESATLVSEVFQANGYQTGGFVAGGHLDPAFGHAQGYDAYSSEKGFASFWNTVPKALQWLDGVDTDRPWYVFLHGYDAHDPYDTAPPFAHLYGADRVTSIAEALIDVPGAMHRVMDRRFRPGKPEVFTHPSGRMVLSMENYDDQVPADPGSQGQRSAESGSHGPGARGHRKSGEDGPGEGQGEKREGMAPPPLDEFSPSGELGQSPSRGPTAKKIQTDKYARALAGSQGRGVTLSDADILHVQDHYDGSVAYADLQLGLFFAALEQRGMLDNTVIVVVADHGEDLFQHGFTNHRVHLYDTILRVPLIVVAPGFAPGTVEHGLVELRDVVPTLLGTAGIMPPAGATGRDLASLVAGESPEADAVFIEGVKDMCAVRTATHKLVFTGASLAEPDYVEQLAAADLVDGRFLLFDLQDDPDEEWNLLLSPEPQTQALGEDLRMRLVEWRRSLSTGTHVLPQSEVDPEVADQMRKAGYWKAEPATPTSDDDSPEAQP